MHDDDCQHFDRREVADGPGLHHSTSTSTSSHPTTVSSPSATALNDRITWQGNVFGGEKRKCLDYLTTSGMLYKPPVPGDHYMVGMQVNMMDTCWNAAERKKRGVVKPNWWGIKMQDDQRKWGEEALFWSTDWSLK